MKSSTFQGFNVFLKALLASIALISGGAIYFLFRPKGVPFTKIFKSISFFPPYQGNSFLQFVLPEWMIYSLPDGLWAFAYALLISMIWSKNKSIFGMIWMASIPILTFGMELLQGVHLLPGTFCFMDLLFIGLGITLGYLSGRFNLKKI